MTSRNKLYFFASLMTFCFGKAVTFDVNVNVGAASLSNVKTSITKRTDLKTPEWRFATVAPAAGEKGDLLRIEAQATVAPAAADKLWSKDGGSTWLNTAIANETDAAAYQKYVTSVAKEYALEGDYERHHYDYRPDATKNLHKGGFAAGLSLGVKYELNPCFKIGARAFFTATDLKRDLGYKVMPVDQNGNLAQNTSANEREVQMLIGYGKAHNNVAIGTATYFDENNCCVKKDVLTDFAKLAHANDKAVNGDGFHAIQLYALNINRKGYNELLKLEKNNENKYVYNFGTVATNHILTSPIVLTKTTLAQGAAGIVNDETWKTLGDRFISTGATNTDNLRNRNYQRTIGKVTLPTAPADSGFNNATEVEIPLLTKSVNIPGANNGRAVVPGDAAQDNTDNVANSIIKLATIADNDKLVLSEAKYNEILQAFDEMAADLDLDHDTRKIDQTLKVKNVWGGMVTLSWNATDCTMFTLGAGIGVPTVSKIDNLKRKVGFAGMFEISTRVADSLSFGLKYQFNRIKVKDANAATHHLSKVNGNLHIFSANLTFSF